MNRVFDILLLLARPAAGKSEVMRFLKNLPEQDRAERFHVGKITELDDFPMLWAWFEEDALLEKMGNPRLHTDARGYFLHQYLWDVLVERIGLEYQKTLRDQPSDSAVRTVLVEFSRGSEHGGYTSAFSHLLPEMLERMAILYVDVTWEESLRKNRKRFNPEKPESILEHSIPDEKLKVMYEKTDWFDLTAADPQFITIQGRSVPYVVMPNEDDVTTRGGDALAKRLQQSLQNLWYLYYKH
jgi:hypothetical protein